MTKYGIKINEEKRTKVEDLIGLANSRAQVRIGNLDDLLSALQEITKKFSISKKALEGCKFRINSNPQEFPNAYLKKVLPEARTTTRKCTQGTGTCTTYAGNAAGPTESQR